jgi:hypothetical protein
MTNFAILPLNSTSELNTLEQKLIKGGLFNNSVDFNRETILQNVYHGGRPLNLKNQVIATSGSQVIIDSEVKSIPPVV